MAAPGDRQIFDQPFPGKDFAFSPLKVNRCVLFVCGSSHFSSLLGVVGSHLSRRLNLFFVISYKITGNPLETTWLQQTCSRANFRAAGMVDEDFAKPFVTIAAPYSNALPCNMHFYELAMKCKDEIEKRGGVAVVHFPPVISDGATNGTEAMKYSLVSRDHIADVIELMHQGYTADAIITLGGCDKSVPGALMPIGRMNAIGISLYGGAAWPGHYPGKRGLDGGRSVQFGHTTGGTCLCAV
jgi:dihydroxyacid dehydratase/phosphogluconate dehydratase